MEFEHKIRPVQVKDRINHASKRKGEDNAHKKHALREELTRMAIQVSFNILLEIKKKMICNGESHLLNLTRL